MGTKFEVNTIGVTPRGAGGPTGYLVPQSNRHVTLFDDFVHSSISATADAAAWMEEQSNGSGGAFTLGDGHGGFLVMTNDGTDDDELLVYENSEWLLPAATKRLEFETRLKCSRVDTSIFAGLTLMSQNLGDANATLLGSGIDQVGFHLDETANIEFLYQDGTTSSDTDTASDLVADTFVTLGFVYDGKSKMKVYVDGSLVLTKTDGALPNQEVCLGFGVRNGSAAAGILTVDYVYCHAEM